MSRDTRDAPVFVELETYRLAQYAVQVPCYICGEGNPFDGELCRHCYAPMALAHQAQSQKVAPQLLATLGPSGVGKTVYLGMLIDMLSRQPGCMQILTRGGFSVNIQQATIESLSRGEFPVKTPNEPDRWNWVHCQVGTGKRRRPVELIVPDMAGESILEEIEHPFTYQVVRAFLSRCTGLLVLVDPTRLHAGYHEQDFFTMKLLNYLMELDSDPKHGWPTRPVAFVFSKADQCEECFTDPAGFARTHTPGLWRHCQERFRRHKFFAAGVAGATAWRDTRDGRQRVPLRVEPRGIVESFQWLVQEISS
jgi:hypothetical protein